MTKSQHTLRQLITLGVIAISPLSVFAQTVLPPSVLTLMGKIYTAILNPIIIFLFALAFLYFMYGILQMVWNGDSEGEREKGRKSMLWGIIGMFIMFSVFTIIRILVNSFGGDLSATMNTV